MRESLKDREREERERESLCVRERERERACVCVCERERLNQESMSGWLRNVARATFQCRSRAYRHITRLPAQHKYGQRHDHDKHAHVGCVHAQTAKSCHTRCHPGGQDGDGR